MGRALSRVHPGAHEGFTLHRCVLALMALESSLACAQSTPAAPPGAMTVLIVGQRASLASAQAIKRDAPGIVDAVVAEDIDKLPDASVTEALQRVSGVQIVRDRGEGTGVTARGLTQIETLLNGREVFTASGGRVLDFADLPADLVSRLQVHKSASPEQIEGGMGGLIDVRTRRPFDTTGRQAALSLRAIHGDLAHAFGEQATALWSDRWRADHGGEFGALVSLSYQRRAWREDQKSTGAPNARGDLIAGQSVMAPTSTTETTSVGRRERSAADATLQWRPAPGWDLYAQGSFAQFKTRQDSYQINVFTSAAQGQDVTLFPGTSDVRSATWLNAPLSILSFARDTVDRMGQMAMGGSWNAAPLKLSADLSRTTAFNNLFFSGPTLSGTAASMSQDLSSTVPATRLAGTDLMDPASLRYSSIAYRVLPFHGDLNAARLDAEYTPGAGIVDLLSAGLRYAARGATNAPGLAFGDTAVSLPASQLPDTLVARPYDDLLPGSASLHNYLVGNIDAARDAAAYRQRFGISAALPTASSNPTSLWSIDEQTQAAYVNAHLLLPRAALGGNLGLRLVSTHESVNGWQTVSGSVYTPVAVDARYTDVLPSMDLRWAPGDGGWVLRAAASKTVTRPDFNQLSPSITLVQQPTDPTGNSNLGSAGNPDLRPIRSDNVDLALERQSGAGNASHVTVFWKNVDGFLITTVKREIHDGVGYNVSRPQNANPAHVKGAELGLQQFFDFLPGWLGGLGLQATYTYIDSDTPNAALGVNQPLQNLSRNNANLVGIYERGPWTLRAAYNWRDRFLSGVNAGGFIFTRAYGWLDASLRYRYSELLTFSLEGLNLLRTERSSYYSVPTRPQSNWLNDRQLVAAATMHF